MIKVLIGLNRDIRRAALMDTIKERVNAKQDDLYLIVPEETTFITQRELLLKLGNSASRYIESVGFDRMKDRIYAMCGHKVKCMDDGGRYLTMATALQHVKKQLSAYKASAQRPDFLKLMLRTNDMLAENEISVEKALAAEVISDSLKAKLTDIELIMNEYAAICKQSDYDPIQELIRLPELIRSFAAPSLAKAEFFSDGFAELTPIQAKILIALSEVSRGLTITLPCEDDFDSRVTSKSACRTIGMLKKLAGEENVQLVSLPNTRTDHMALYLLQSELCSDSVSTPHDIENAEKRIRLFADPTNYAEIQHIAGTILQTVRNDKYRFSDISVVLPDFDHYAPIVEQVFKRYDIPAYFASRKDEITHRPIMQAICCALDAVTRGMPKIEVLQFLKSGMAGLTMDEADKVENYALMWNIHGRGWSPDGGWVMHPDGYGREFDEDSEKRLDELNALREKGVTPLLHLMANMKDAETVGGCVLAFNEFLKDVSFTDTLQNFVNELIEAGDRQTAQEYAQINEVLCTALEQMHGIIGKLETNPNDFAKLLNMMVSAYSIATIPSTIDQVQVFNIADSRHICSKIRYFAGCREGMFPSYDEGNSAILSVEDSQELSRILDMNIPGTVDNIVERQLTDINSSIAGAKQMLIFSYPYGEDSTPSSLYLRVHQLLPAVVEERGAGEDGIYKADLLHAASCAKLLGRISQRGEYSHIAIQLADCLGEDEETMDISTRIMDKAAWALNDLSNESVKGLYGETIPLSASRTDVYSACRYRFFLQYGIGVREKIKSGLTSPVFGSFAHAVLEGAVREVESLGGFAKVSREDIHAITRKHIEAYTESKLKSLEGQPERYTYLHMRNVREVLSIMDTMTRELSRSDFHARELEFRVGGKDAQMPAIDVHGKEADGEYTGIIDRIDGAVVDGKPYFRVIDYKTGKTKTVDVTDILIGQTTQLLLYQSAVHKLYKDENMAGFLYVPAKDSILAMQVKPEDDEVVTKERQKMHMRHGMVVNDPAVIYSMEHVMDGAKPEYIPVSKDKNGNLKGEICTPEQLEMLNLFIDRQMGDIVDGIHSGKVAANPVSRGPERNACVYCPMKDACHKDATGTKFQYHAKVTNEEFFHIVETRVRQA